MFRNSYTARQPIKTKKNKYKLFCLIIRRATIRNLRETFTTFKINYQNQLKCINLIAKNSSINLQVCRMLAWEKLKANSHQGKGEERLFKDAMILCRKLETLAMRKAFNRIQIWTYRSDGLAVKRMLTCRNSIISRIVKKLFLHKKKEVFFRLQKNFRSQKIIKRLLILPLIRKNLQKKLLLQAWSAFLLRMGKGIQPGDEKIQQLETQLQDMKIQIQNKNENIEKLNVEINELKENVSGRFDTTSFMAFQNHTKSYTSLNKSRARPPSSYDKQSNDAGSIKEESFGSLFSGSFFSHKSRNKSQKKIGSEDCSCSCYQKYERYKNANQTLKKQLQIIKTELQFTKDMNEHMESQMKQYFGSGQESARKIEKLRGQLKEVQREREVLKEKIVKYEKYVSKLKTEFKLKIQQIYRKVRRNG